MVMSYKKSSGGKAGDYYVLCQTNAIDDYYANNNTEAKEPPGEWFVADRSESFGLIDGQKFNESDTDRFRALVNGFHPETGEMITQNSGSLSRTALHDFTFSAPKSVSVAWAMSDEKIKAQISDAQRLASREALNFMSEKAGFTRRGKGGAIKERVDLCGALFEHGSSRGGQKGPDPQLHTHGTIFNAAVRQDGTMGSIETRELFAFMGAGASIYHASLSARLSEIGFEIERKDKLFEIKGVSDSVQESFSQRREQILEHAEKMARERGMDVSAVLSSQGLMQEAAIETRDQKGELTRAEMQVMWNKRGAELGFTSQQVTELLRENHHQPLTQEARALLTHDVESQLTAMQATFSEPALYTAVAVRMIGRGGLADIEKAVEDVKDRLLVTHLEDGRSVFTTAEMRLIEERTMELAGKKDHRHVIDRAQIDEAIARRSSMTDEQADAVRHVLSDEKRVSVLQGAAGSGKTYSLKTIAESYKAQDYELHAIAAPWSAADNLRKEAGLDSHRAIAGWLNDIDSGAIALNAKSVVVVDEAGMVSVRDMARILEAAEAGGAKVVLTGDELQFNSIQAGDSLRIISERHGCARIDGIQRQKTPDGSINRAHVDAIKDLFDGRASKAMTAFKDNIHLNDGADANNRALFSAWANSRAENPDKTQLMISVRNKDVAALNKMAHEHLKNEGLIDTEKSLAVRAVDSSKDRPEVEFSAGDSVQFRNNQHTLGVYNRTRATITDIDGPTIYLRTGEGQTIKMDTRDSLWHMNGTRDLALQHSYAVTGYGSQGLTVDDTFINPAGMDRRAIGVAASRHRNSVSIFADRVENYTKMMEIADKQDWRDPSKVTDAEILEHMKTQWERNSHKTSTLDYESSGWKSAATGEAFDVKTEMQLKTLKDAGVVIDRCKRESLGQPDLAFQKAPGYAIDERLPTLGEHQKMNLRADLVNDGVSASALLRAEQQGVLHWGQQRDGETILAPTFVARDQAGRAVNAVSEQKIGDAVQCDGALRHRYRPTLVGDSSETHVVRTGRDALAIWTTHEAENKPLPTVIIAGDRPDALVHEQTQNRLREAEKIVVYEPAQQLNVNADVIEQRQSVTKAAENQERVAVQQYESGQSPAETLQAQMPPPEPQQEQQQEINR